MAWRRSSRLFIVAPIALLLLGTAGGLALHAGTSATPVRIAQAGVKQTGWEPVDIATIDWIDADTGKPTFAPPVPLGALRSSVPAVRLPLSVSPTGSCGTIRYKVLYYRPYDDTLAALCFTGTGIWSGPTDVYRVVGVCPGVNRGNIHYTMYSGATYWSTMRGPYASNSQCYKFPADGRPVDFDKVQLLAYPY